MEEADKSLGQLAFEFMIERSMNYMLEEGFKVGELRWDSLTPQVQKDWEDTANTVVKAYLKRNMNSIRKALG